MTSHDHGHIMPLSAMKCKHTKLMKIPWYAVARGLKNAANQFPKSRHSVHRRGRDGRLRTSDSKEEAKAVTAALSVREDGDEANS